MSGGTTEVQQNTDRPQDKMTDLQKTQLKWALKITAIAGGLLLLLLIFF